MSLANLSRLSPGPVPVKEVEVCPVVLSHAPGPMSARVNGVYVPTGDRSFGQPVFHNPHTDMWLEYFDFRWVVREGGVLTGPPRYIASTTPGQACLPHECVVGGWSMLGSGGRTVTAAPQLTAQLFTQADTTCARKEAAVFGQTHAEPASRCEE